jgi:hypothetical protein
MRSQKIRTVAEEKISVQCSLYYSMLYLILVRWGTPVGLLSTLVCAALGL